MRLATAKAGGGDFKPAPAGTHRAVCVKFIDLGSHEETYQGRTSMKRKVVLGFELVDELDDFGGEQKPFIIMRFFTWSMGEKSNLRPFLENWRGKGFTADELQNFDVKSLLGAGCLLTVTHKEKKGGGTRAEASGIAPLMKGMERPVSAWEHVYIALEPGLFDQSAFEGLSDFYKQQIEASPEWLALDGPPPASSSEAQASTQNTKLDDEIPF